MTDIFGSDIRIDGNLVAQVAANGELVLTSETETAVQNIVIRLATPLGSLFYDTEFGSLLHEFYDEENTEDNRLALKTELEDRIEESNQVIEGSVDVEIIAWDETGISVICSFDLIVEDHTHNLAIALDWINEKKEILIKDVSTY